MLRMATNTTIGRRKIGQKGRITTISSVHYAAEKSNNPPCPSPFSLAVQQPIVNHHQQQQQKYYSSTSRKYFAAAAAAWWNPFSRGDKSTTYVSSGKTTTTSSSSSTAEGGENPRKTQERKDAMLVALALEFRKLSLENPTLDRDTLVDRAFDSLELEELDNKTQMQLRRYVQQSLDGQILDLFHTFQIVDDALKPMSDDYDDDMNYMTLYNQMLEVELERTIDALADPNPLQAPKGPSSKQFLELKRGALETLLQNRKEQQQKQQKQDKKGNETTTITTKPPEEEKEEDNKSDDDDEDRRVTWVDADNFGFHESSIDPDRNRLIRHYQTVNLCRSAKMREEWGFSVLALQSSVAGAGRGIYVDGYAKAGSILAFQPGQVWAREHMMNLSVEDQRQLQTNDNYQMSLRYDDFMIDSRKSPYTVLTEPNSNLMALGHIVNHPTPSKPPNCRSIMVNFTQELDLEKLNLDRYIPNTYAKPRNLGLVGTLMHGGTGDSVEIMQSLCLIATRDICNEELFYDYRLLTPQRPQWYHVVEDTAFVDNTEEEKENPVVSEKKGS